MPFVAEGSGRAARIARGFCGRSNRAFGPLPYRLFRQSSLVHKHERRRPKGLRRRFLDSIYSEYQTGQGNCVIFGELIFPRESMI